MRFRLWGGSKPISTPTSVHLNENEMRNGCLFGNFTAELGDQSEAIRGRILRIFAEVRDSIGYCLDAAVTGGELPSNFDCEETAAFIVAALQGAILISKAERSPKSVERFKDILFSRLLS